MVHSTAKNSFDNHHCSWTVQEGAAWSLHIADNATEIVPSHQKITAE